MFHPVEFRQWLAMRTNRPYDEADEAAVFGAYREAPAGAPLVSLPASVAKSAATPTDLLVVVTTYGRPVECASLLAHLADSVEDAGLSPRTFVLVLHDACGKDYADARHVGSSRFGERCLFLDAVERLGKPGFHVAYQAAFLVARALSPTHALFLQDDVEFEPTMVRDALARFEALVDDPDRRVLYLFASEEDEPSGRWVHFRRRDVPGRSVRLTQWFDLQAFLVDRRFFELLSYRVIPIHPNRWKRNRSISSGVGRQFTVRLRRRGNVYQAEPTLVHHGAAASEMNPEARAQRPLDNRPRRG